MEKSSVYYLALFYITLYLFVDKFCSMSVCYFISTLLLGYVFVC